MLSPDAYIVPAGLAYRGLATFFLGRRQNIMFTRQCLDNVDQYMFYNAQPINTLYNSIFPSSKIL